MRRACTALPNPWVYPQGVSRALREIPEIDAQVTNFNNPKHLFLEEISDNQAAYVRLPT